MKQTKTWALTALCLAAGVARWLDLNNFSQQETGFALTGPYWLRYLILLVLAAVIWLAGRRVPPKNQALEGWGMGAAALLGGVMLAFVGGDSLTALGWKEAILPGLAAVWLLVLGAAWLGLGAAWQVPLPLAIAGTLYFLLQSFQYGLTYASNLQRIGVVWQALAYLAGLWFLVRLLRQIYLPGEGASCYSAGLLAFLLCSCLNLPQVVFWFLVGQNGVAVVSVIEAAGLAMVGLMGLGAAFALARE